MRRHETSRKALFAQCRQGLFQARDIMRQTQQQQQQQQGVALRQEEQRSYCCDRYTQPKEVFETPQFLCDHNCDVSMVNESPFADESRE